jgi:hypothetical protein
MVFLKNESFPKSIRSAGFGITIAAFIAVVNILPGCETYTKNSRSCDNGVCTTVKEKCEKGSCTITTCTKGKCTTTYSGSHPLAKENLNKKNDGKTSAGSADGGKNDSLNSFKPTANHRIFIKYIDGYEKSRANMPDETSAMRQFRMDNFDKSVFKKIFFKNLILVDVKPDCLAGFGECNNYIVIFSVNLTDAGESDTSVSGNYKAPTVIKHHVCKKEALKYKPGKRYDVSGKVSGYKVVKPKHNENSFIREYFYSGYENSIELDKQEYYRCSKK